jgi:alpha,alpha-trehalase
MKNSVIFISILLFLSCRENTDQAKTIKKSIETKSHLSPDERFLELFKDVQLGAIFPDSKTFVDCTPKFSTDEILEKYQTQKEVENFDLKNFVLENFDLPKQFSTNFKSDKTRSPKEHITALWPILTRQADSITIGSLLALPKPYIVPGGRFGEIYYWDSYFTILGLQADHKNEMIENMADNFAHLINTVGHVPNGNRTYYLSRSQPPFFSLIVDVVYDIKGENSLKKYLPALEKEYAFWMDGSDKLTTENTSYRRVVHLQEGLILNRYWDDKPTPRPESYKEDVAIAKESNRPAKDVYRDIKAGAESGWDFSSRWFRDGKTLATIHTTEIIPVDLNCLLHHLEKMLEKAYNLVGNVEKGKVYAQKARSRAKAIQLYCWGEAKGFYFDYDFVKKEQTSVYSLAGIAPLFFNISNPKVAKSVAQKIKSDFLQPGGLTTTLSSTNEQWDAPNGWAPLQWMAIQGLRNYQQNELAEEIKKRWIALNTNVYKNTGKMVEKYNVYDLSLKAGGGEYPVQDGFGWTNGVLLKLLNEKNK